MKINIKNGQQNHKPEPPKSGLPDKININPQSAFPKSPEEKNARDAERQIERNQREIDRLEREIADKQASKED